MLNVLITCAGGYGNQDKFNAIKNNPDNEQTKIITCDIKNYDLLKHQSDKFYQISETSDPNWTNKLLQICNS